MNPFYPVLCVVAILGAGFAVLLRKLASRPDIAGSESEWLAGFSLESYAPMERLLDERDFAFLEKQPGYNAGIANRLRAERKEVFRAYLGRLVKDFNRLLRISRMMLVYSVEDRTDFAKSLWRQQMTFYFAISMLRFRLALYPWVLGTWDTRGLVQGLGQLQYQLRQQLVSLTPEPSEI